MTYYFFELHPIFTSVGVFKNRDEQPKVVYSLTILDDIDFYDYMEQNLYHDLIWDNNFYDSFELDKYYYVIPDSGYDCYVFSMHKGHCFYDVAEHDDRVIISVELGIDPSKMYI